MTPVQQDGSSSIEQPDYWWHRARAGLLEAALGGFLGEPKRLLDVGSADGPSVGWMRGEHVRVAVDVDILGLRPGEGVGASASALPFADECFDVVGAFDVIEHCEDEALAAAELARVLAPGGRLLISVPAYQWAWSGHDIRAGHYRRYTLPRLVAVVEGAGLEVQRQTYAFCLTFPFFVAERLQRRLLGRSGRAAAPRLTPVSPRLEKVLMWLSRAEQKALRSRDMPFGSSVFLSATKPAK